MYGVLRLSQRRSRLARWGRYSIPSSDSCSGARAGIHGWPRSSTRRRETSERLRTPSMENLTSRSMSWGESASVENSPSWPPMTAIQRSGSTGNTSTRMFSRTDRASHPLWISTAIREPVRWPEDRPLGVRAPVVEAGRPGVRRGHGSPTGSRDVCSTPGIDPALAGVARSPAARAVSRHLADNGCKISTHDEM